MISKRDNQKHVHIHKNPASTQLAKACYFHIMVLLIKLSII